MCHVPLTHGTCFDSFLLVLERLNGFGPDRFCSARNDDINIMRSNAICCVILGTCLWHMARFLTILIIAAERLIRCGLDRRRSTQGKDGDVVKSISGCCQNGTFHVPLARAIQLTQSPLEPDLQPDRDGKNGIKFVFARKRR